MLKISDTTKFQLKKAGLLSSLFLALFFAGFYVVNLLDIKAVTKEIQQISVVQESTVKEDLATKTALDGINLADFQTWAKANGLTGTNIYNSDPDGDGLPNNLEYIHGTDPNNKDTDGDKYTDKDEIINGYDPTSFGDAKTAVFVQIEKMKVDAPMVWSKSEEEKSSLKDLENGLSHFPKSATPGENGNVIISGHSSNYVWAKGDYNYIFKNLNDLNSGDIVNIKTVQKNGKIISYKYQISDKFVTTPDDERIFAETENPTLTLSTCWPLGTNLKRLIVKAELI